MYNVSSNFSNYIKMPSRTFSARLVIGSNTYTDTEIVDMSLESNLVPGEEFTLGTTICSKFEATLITTNRIFALSVLKPYIGLIINDNVEEVPLGVFNADPPKVTKINTKIIAYDNMIKFEKAYFSDLTYPAAIQVVATEICKKAGVSFSSSLPNFSIGKIEGKTLREAIGIVAGICGGFARINRVGNLEIVSLTSTDIAITTDNFYGSIEKVDKNFTIRKITAIKEDNSTISSGSGLSTEEVTFSNNYITQSQLDSVLNVYSDYSYRPIKFTWQGNPALDVGDKITITDVDNTMYSIPVMRLKLTYHGGLKNEISSIAKGDSKAEYDYKGPVAKKIERLVIEQANIKVLMAEKANIEDLTATNGRITTLESRAASIDTLLAGKLSAENMQTGFITANSGLIAKAAIKDAMIDTVGVNKILAGDISTNRFRIVSDAGNMIISDNTIQIKDASRVRVQIGKDASNDYNMYVWDATGNLMFDATGLKASGIKSKIICDDMVSDTANISGQKINIRSLLGTINMTKTIVDGTDTSIIYTGNWGIENNAGFYGGTAKYSSNLNDKIQYTFTGIGINIYFVKSPGSGIAEILIDGVSKGTFDCYAVNATFNVLGFSTNTLPSGTHTVTINVTHTKNASATNYYVEFDYFEVIKLGNTSTLSSSKVYLDTQTQTLDLAFTSLSSTVTSQGRTITNQGESIGIIQGQISSKIWSSDITTAVNNVQVGGRNLLRNSQCISLGGSDRGNPTVSIGTDDGNYNKILVNTAGYNNRWTYVDLTSPIVQGKYYTLSVDIKTSGNSDKSLHWYANYSSDYSSTVIPTDTSGKWVRVYVTTLISNTVTGHSLFDFKFTNAVVGEYIYAKNYKIEEGNKNTSYTIAPEDTDAQITTITNKYSSLNQTVNSICADVGSLQTDTSELGTRITSAEGSIAAFNDSIVLKVTQTDIDTSISKIQVGAKNLLRNSKGDFVLAPRDTGTAPDNYNYYSFSNFSDVLVTGQQYTVSADIEITAGAFTSVTIYDYPGGTATSVPIINGKVEKTFIQVNTTTSILIYAGIAGTTRGNGIKIRNVKVEKGNKATDWAPAPEDTQSQLDNAVSRISTSESNITQLSKSINLKVNITDFNSLTGRVSTTESNISVLQGQIVNKVEVNGVKSIISQSATEVQTAFNGATGLFTIKNGNLVLQNASSANVMWVDTNGLLTTNKLHVYGDSNNVLIDGTGHKGVDLNSTNGGDCYIQFNNGSYSARIQSTSSAPNALVMRGSGGIQVEGSIYTQTYVKCHGVNGQANQALELNRYGGNGQTIVCNGDGSGGGGGLQCGSFYASGNATIAGTIYVGDLKYNSGNLALWAPNITHFYNVSSSNYMAIYDTNGTTYGATIWVSDANLKNSIADSSKSALDYVMRIQHRQFNWNSTGEHCDIGYISQELMGIDPNLVFGVPQENGNTLYHPKIDVLVPMLSKAIQELKREKDSEIVSLKEEINILKSLLEKI